MSSKGEKYAITFRRLLNFAERYELSDKKKALIAYIRLISRFIPIYLYKNIIICF